MKINWLPYLNDEGYIPEISIKFTLWLRFASSKSVILVSLSVFIPQTSDFACSGLDGCSTSSNTYSSV